MNLPFDQQLKRTLQQVELPKHSAHRKQLRRHVLNSYQALHAPKRMTWKPFVFFTLPAALVVAGVALVLTQLPHQPTPLANLNPKEVLADSLANAIKELEQRNGSYIKAETDYQGFVTTYESWKQGYSERIDYHTSESFGSDLSLRPDANTQLYCSTDALNSTCFTMGVADSSSTLDLVHEPNFTPAKVEVVVDDLPASTGQELALILTTNTALSDQADIRIVDKDSVDDVFSMVGMADFFNRPDGVLPNEFNAKQLPDGKYQYRISIPSEMDIRFDDPTFNAPNSHVSYVQFTDGNLVSPIYGVNSETLSASILTGSEVEAINAANTQYEENMAFSTLDRTEAQGSMEPFSQLKREYQYALDNGEVLSSTTDADNHLVISYRYQYETGPSGVASEPIHAVFTIDQTTKRIVGYQMNDEYTTRIIEVRPLTEHERTVTLSEADWKATITKLYQQYYPGTPMPDLTTAHY